ncbi:MAG: toll/interleukin-1 receptor domain-containing protein [Bacteroidota bacterium]
MFDPNIPVKIFTSYAHDDESLREKLDKHMAMIRRHPAVHIWNDRGIEPGEEWDEEIKKELDSADIILLLVSSNFLASDYIYKVELKGALEKHAAKEAVVIPIIMKPCDWTFAEFAMLQGLPKNAKPVSKWDDEDEALVDVVKGINRVILRVQKRKG